VYIVFADEARNCDCSHRLEASKYICVGTIPLQDHEPVDVSLYIPRPRCDPAWNGLTLECWCHTVCSKQVVRSSVLRHWLIFDVTRSGNAGWKTGQEVEHSKLASYRWTYVMIGVRCGMALLSTLWALLPDDLRDALVNALSR
jgi:hypothetical protein